MSRDQTKAASRQTRFRLLVVDAVAAVDDAVVVDVVVVVVAVDSEVVSFCCPQSCSQVSIAKL